MTDLAEQGNVSTAICEDPQPTIATHNGTITMFNPRTGQHRTVRIKTQKEDATFAPSERIIGLLIGPDNTMDYLPFGFVKTDGRVIVWRKHRGNKIARMVEDPEAFNQLGIEYNWDEVKCRKCNRDLTEPVSQTLGIGPTCRNK